MKVKMMIVALGLGLVIATQVSAQCGPCDAVNPCNSCNTCCAKPCDLFSGLKTLLKSRPCATGCAPCDPIVACDPCTPVVECDPCTPVVECDPCTPVCDPCTPACDPGCNTGCRTFGFKIRNPFKGAFGCNAGCDPCGRVECDPCAKIECDPCTPVVECDPCEKVACSPCGQVGCGNECYCPGPVAELLIKSRVNARKFFKGFIRTFECGCSPCGPVGCDPCTPVVECDPCGKVNCVH